MKPSIWVFVEFIIGAVIALIFHVGLNKPDIAYMILAVSILIAFATHLIIVNLSTEIKDRNEIYLLLDEIKDREFKEEGIKIIEDCKKRLKELSEGCYTYPTIDKSFDKTIDWIKKAKSTMLAVSIEDKKNWNETIFLEYFNQNIKAVKRGVGVSRIFILNENDIKDKEMIDIIKRQKNAGFNVFYAMSDKVPFEIQKDFVIIDKKVVFTVERGEKGIGRGIKNTSSVENYIQIWEELRRRSTDVDELIRK